ncbi:MAG: precorrin-6y C5,15-methyltransferase (decarboxylating) subunit CbiE [Synergistaceae bacterium]|jgi:precorrin-6Y C5,15-methyltransferase (decarboxylating)|nr:precorrin-6y C5,15-methyltransferase (decarboxylating) subunit CbiE [Synergistaceae bacterium]
MERHKLYVVSVGPGGDEHLTRAAESVLKTADCVAAAKRHMRLVEGHGNVLPLESPDEVFEKIAENLNNGSVAVAVSGDAGIFSLMPRLQRAFPERDITVIPGVSALQSLCAEIGETWDSAEIVSFHGRDVPPAKAVGIAMHAKKTFFFCGPGHGPEWVCRLLAERGVKTRIAVGERLSYSNGRVVTGSALELSSQVFDPLSVVMVSNPDPLPLLVPRPRDEDFLRSPSVPMTRGEVRTVILDRLSLELEAVVWDVGAGTGSVAVACSRLCPYGEVHAVERLPEAARLLRANKENFRAYNLFIHEGEARNLLETLPRPTHVFIGGSGGALREILGHVKKLSNDDKNRKIFVTVSGVALKTIGMAYEILSGEGFSGLDVTQVAISRSRSVGSSLILAAQNPVTLLSAYAGK